MVGVMTKQSKASEAVTCFGEGFNCAQSVFSTYCEEFGMDRKTALQVSCGLGAGLGRLQGTCGAVTGACLLIGLKHGGVSKDGGAAKESTYAKVQEFVALFEARNGTTSCRELLGVDLLAAERRTAAERVNSVCPKMVRDAAEIVEEILFAEEF